jgi:hypothetical protein
MKRFTLVLGSALLAAAGFGGHTAQASTATGQVAFGHAQVEPAYDGATGNQIFLGIPSKATTSTSQAWTPLYLPMYPTNSNLGMLDCTPDNCDHVNVLPSGLVSALGLDSVYPEGTISTQYGSFTGGLVKGHDHVTGGRESGSGTPVTRHVFLVLFTPQGVADGAINTELTTDDAISAAIAAGDAVGPIDTGAIVHAAVVSPATFR